jgi:hypothetical protein
MRKLKLDLEALEVDSFDALPARRGRGTVAAHLIDAEYAYYDDPFGGWNAGGGGGGGYTVGTCIGPTFCCAPTWDCPVINTNTTVSRVMSAVVPCSCG